MHDEGTLGIKNKINAAIGENGCHAARPRQFRLIKPAKVLTDQNGRIPGAAAAFVRGN